MYHVLVPAGLDINKGFSHFGAPWRTLLMDKNVDHGADPEEAPLVGQTPLELAIKAYGSLQTIKLLVEHGGVLPQVNF